MRLKASITKAIRKRINRITHEAAQRLEVDLRSKLLGEIEAMARIGSSLDEMHALLDRWHEDGRWWGR